MPFWDKLSPIEPLKQFRWSMSIIDSSDISTEIAKNQGNTLFEHSLKECSKPEYEVSTTQHKLLTQTTTYPGLLKWKPINVKLASILNSKKTVDRLLEDMLRASGYSPIADYSINDDEEGNRTIDYDSPYHQNIEKDKSFDIKLDQYNSNGAIVEYWSLFNCFFSSVSYGKLSYSSEEIVEISLTIQYDWATQTRVQK